MSIHAAQAPERGVCAQSRRHTRVDLDRPAGRITSVLSDAWIIAEVSVTLSIGVHRRDRRMLRRETAQHALDVVRVLAEHFEPIESAPAS